MGKIAIPRYRAQLNIARRSVDLFDFAEGSGLDARTPGEEIKAIAYLNDWEAQVLLDDLWAAGIRPSRGVASAGALDEAHEHIETLRRMVRWVNA